MRLKSMISKKKTAIMKMVEKRYKTKKNLKYKSKFVEWMKQKYLLNFRRSPVNQWTFCNM